MLVTKTYRDEGMRRGRGGGEGPGMQSGWRMEESEGIGLANTAARLRHLYGPEHRFELRNADGGGMVAAVALPFRLAYGATSGR